MSTTTALLSFAEFEALPDNEKGLRRQLIEGEPIESPPPEIAHVEIAIAVLELLRTVQPRSRVWPGTTGYQIGRDSWLVPDVSVTWPNQEHVNGYFQNAPMLAIEIVSPANRRREIERKMRLYLRHSGAAVWVINRETRDMTVWTSKDEQITGVIVTGVWDCPVTGVRLAVGDVLRPTNE